jgi:hypothetical protein
MTSISRHAVSVDSRSMARFAIIPAARDDT